MIETKSLRLPEPLHVLLFHLTQGFGRATIAQGRLHRVEWLVRLSFRSFVKRHALAPNGRWLYALLGHGTTVLDLRAKRLIWLARASSAKPEETPSTAFYALLWSPDGRHLAGHPTRFYSPLVLATPPEAKLETLIGEKMRVYFYGWYPDGNRLWCLAAERSNHATPEYYQLKVPSGRPRLLSEAEANHLRKQLDTDWDFLCSAFRNEADSEWWYTADRQMRVTWVVEKKAEYLQVERRQGRPLKVRLPFQVQEPHPTDVSSDKQWVLVRTSDNNLYALHLPSHRWQVVPGWEDLSISELFLDSAILRVDFAQSARLIG